MSSSSAKPAILDARLGMLCDLFVQRSAQRCLLGQPSRHQLGEPNHQRRAPVIPTGGWHRCLVPRRSHGAPASHDSRTWLHAHSAARQHGTQRGTIWLRRSGGSASPQLWQRSRPRARQLSASSGRASRNPIAPSYRILLVHGGGLRGPQGYCWRNQVEDLRAWGRVGPDGRGQWRAPGGAQYLQEPGKEDDDVLEALRDTPDS